MAEFPTFNGSWPWPWPWIGSYCIPSCITHRPLPTQGMSLKSKKLSEDGRDSHTHKNSSLYFNRFKKTVETNGWRNERTDERHRFFTHPANVVGNYLCRNIGIQPTQSSCIITLAASSRKRKVTAWRPSVRPSVRLSRRHTHRNSPRSSTRRGQYISARQ